MLAQSSSLKDQVQVSLDSLQAKLRAKFGKSYLEGLLLSSKLNESLEVLQRLHATVEAFEVSADNSLPLQLAFLRSWMNFEKQNRSLIQQLGIIPDFSRQDFIRDGEQVLKIEAQKIAEAQQRAVTAEERAAVDRQAKEAAEQRAAADRQAKEAAEQEIAALRVEIAYLEASKARITTSMPEQQVQQTISTNNTLLLSGGPYTIVATEATNSPASSASRQESVPHHPVLRTPAVH